MLASVFGRRHRPAPAMKPIHLVPPSTLYCYVWMLQQVVLRNNRGWSFAVCDRMDNGHVRPVNLTRAQYGAELEGFVADAGFRNEHAMKWVRHRAGRGGTEMIVYAVRGTARDMAAPQRYRSEDMAANALMVVTGSSKLIGGVAAAIARDAAKTPGADVVVTGHSLGGSIAIAAGELLVAAGRPSPVFAFAPYITDVAAVQGAPDVHVYAVRGDVVTTGLVTSTVSRSIELLPVLLGKDSPPHDLSCIFATYVKYHRAVAATRGVDDFEVVDGGARRRLRTKPLEKPPKLLPVAKPKPKPKGKQAK